MVVTIDYGEKKLELSLPDSAKLDEYSCRYPAGKYSWDDFIPSLEAAEKEIFPFEEADLVVVNDAYRPTPTGVILQHLHEAGKISDRARFLIATGCHPKPDELQLESIFGPLYRRLKDRIAAHDARNISDMHEVGHDAEGNMVYLNGRFLRADKVAIIGSVEPHYFAGFTGGRKAVFPGLCDLATTARNHNRAADFNARPLRLEGNPVEENLKVLLSMIGRRDIICIQTVVGPGRDTAGLFCGSMEESFKKACALAEELYLNQAREAYDLLLAEVRPPLDSNLYQLQKSLENSQQAVCDGGTMLLFSPCREGIGSGDFYRLADRYDAGAAFDLSDETSFGYHKLYRVSEISRRINLFLYSELAEGIPDRVFFQSTREPQAIIDAIGGGKENIRTALVHDAGHTVLTTKQT